MKTKYLIKGKLYDPILFGDEDEDWVGAEENPTCGDCGVHVGEKHLDMCDIERCPACGLQFISCDCGIKYELEEKDMKDLDKYIKKQEYYNKEKYKNTQRILKEIAEYKANSRKSKNKKYDSEM
mgnify:FL=1